MDLEIGLREIKLAMDKEAEVDMKWEAFEKKLVEDLFCENGKSWEETKAELVSLVA